MSVDSYMPFQVPGRATLSPLSPAVTAVSPPENSFSDWGKGADFRHFQRQRAKSVTIVTAFQGPEAWSDGVTRLFAAPCPDFLTDERWTQILFDCDRFCTEWADCAHKLGWSDLDLFGCNPDPEGRRLDRNGLIVSLRGRPVIGMSERAASIDAERDVVTSFYRGFPLVGSAPLWRVLAPEGGP
jgi:hypothetical protein